MNDFEKQLASFREEWFGPEDYITVHTSGSTGEPKLIKLSKKMVRESARRTNAHFNISRGSVLFMSLNPGYIAAKMMMVRAFEAQCRLIAVPPTSTPVFPQKINFITLLAAVPAQIDGYLAALAYKKRLKIRSLLLGGSPVTREQHRKALQVSSRAYESYGMTETASHIALRPLTSYNDVIPAPFRTMKAITVSTDNRGCLVVNVPSIPPIVTNDLARLVSHREFFITGRIDNVIISGGVKVQAEKVEDSLSRFFSEIGPYIVTGRKHAKWGMEVIVKVEAPALLRDGEESAELPDLYERMCVFISENTTLSGAQKPHAVIAVRSLPRTSSGKLIRQ